MTIEDYHKQLIEHLSKSNSLYSINRASPREWIEKSYSPYKKFLIHSIIKEKKIIHRMTVVNSSNADEVNYFDDAFAKTISLLQNIGMNTKNFVDYFLNEDITNEFSLQFDKLNRELNQTNFDLLHLFLQTHNPKDKAIFVCNTFDSEFAELLGAEQKEVLIYDHIALKVKHNKKRNSYTIEETISGLEEINKLRSTWEEVFNKIICHKTKGFLLEEFLTKLEIQDKTTFSLNRYNNDYKGYFKESSSVPTHDIDNKQL